MKTPALIALLVFAILPVQSTFAAADPPKANPGIINLQQYFDAGVAKPTVQINMPALLLKQALGDLSKEEPAIKEAFEGIENVQLMIIEPVAENKDAVSESVTKLRNQLSSTWIPVVSIKDGSDTVGVFIHADASGDRIGGLSLLISSDDSVVVGNLAGNVRFDKLMALSRMSSAQWQGILAKIDPEAGAMLKGMAPGKSSGSESKKESVAEKD